MRLANLVFAFGDFHDKGGHIVAVICFIVIFSQTVKNDVLFVMPDFCFFFMTNGLIGRFSRSSSHPLR
jgi:hypothetical protein